jgi:GT2 family glycosyltransferase
MISIIIPAHKQLDVTKRLVYSIEKYTNDIEHELICVDDCSNDGTYEYFKTVTDKAVYLNTRQGFAYACNKGLETSHKDSTFITCMNNDMFVGPKWLSNLVKAYKLLIERNINIWCVSSKLVYGNFSEEWFLQECSKYVKKEPYQISYVTIGSELFPSVIPKKLIEKYGLFDSEYYEGIFWEDVDIEYRYKREGYIPYCSPDSLVFHFGPGSTVNKIDNIHELYAKNKAVFERKWGVRP